MPRRGETSGGTNDPNSRLGEPARDQCGFLDECPAQRRRLRQHHLGTGAQRLDHRHRWDVRAGAPGTGQLSVSDNRQLPATCTVGCRGDEFGDRCQRAQPLSTPQHVDRGGGDVPQSGGAFVTRPICQFGDPLHRSRQRRIIQPVDHPRCLIRRCGIVRRGHSAIGRTW